MMAREIHKLVFCWKSKACEFKDRLRYVKVMKNESRD